MSEKTRKSLSPSFKEIHISLILSTSSFIFAKFAYYLKIFFLKFHQKMNVLNIHLLFWIFAIFGTFHLVVGPGEIVEISEASPSHSSSHSSSHSNQNSPLASPPKSPPPQSPNPQKGTLPAADKTLNNPPSKKTMEKQKSFSLGSMSANQIGNARRFINNLKKMKAKGQKAEGEENANASSKSKPKTSLPSWGAVNNVRKFTKNLKEKATETRSLKQEYLSKIVKPDKYQMPADFGGIIVQMPSNEPNEWHFSSTDSMLTAFLEFTKIVLADDYAELGRKIRLPAGGCRVKFTPEKEIFHKAFLFEQGCNIHGEQPQKKRQAKPQNSSVKRDGNAQTEGQITIQIEEEEQKEGQRQRQPKQQSVAAEESPKEKEEKSARLKLAGFYDEEYKIKLSTFALLEAIQKGKFAFGETAELDWTKLPEWIPEEKREKEERTKGMAFIMKRVVNMLRQKDVYTEVRIEQKIQEEINKTENAEKIDDKIEARVDEQQQQEVHIDIIGEDKSAEILSEIQQISTEDRENMAMALENEIVELEKSQTDEEIARKGKEENRVNTESENAKKQKVVLGDGRQKIVTQHMHPWKFLQLYVRYQILVEPVEERLKNDPEASMGCGFLKSEVLEKALYGSSHPIAEDVRGRLAAQLLFAVINTKKFTRYLLMAMLASMAFSGGLTTGLNVYAWKSVQAAAAKYEAKRRLGHRHPLSTSLNVGLYSATSFFTQLGDSFFIARLLVKMRGGHLFTSAWQAWVDLKDAALSGFVSMLGSVPNNIQLNTNAYDQPLWIFANDFIMAATSMVMVPIQYNKMEQNLITAVLIMMDRGFFPKLKSDEIKKKMGQRSPVQITRDKFWAIIRRKSKMEEEENEENEEEQKGDEVMEMKDKKKRKAIRQLIRERIGLSMEVDKNTGTMLNSLGFGTMVALLGGFLPTYAGTRIGFITKTWQSIIDNVILQPTESYSLGLAYFTANNIGGERIQHLMGTDASKTKWMIRKIFQKGAIPSTNGHLGQISDSEVRQVHNPWGKLALPLGKLMLYIINWIASKTAQGWRELLGQKEPKHIVDSLEIRRLESGHITIELNKEEAERIGKEIHAILADFHHQSGQQPAIEICQYLRQENGLFHIFIQESHNQPAAIKNFLNEIEKGVGELMKEMIGRDKNGEDKKQDEGKWTEECAKEIMILRALIELERGLAKQLERAFGQCPFGWDNKMGIEFGKIIRKLVMANGGLKQLYDLFVQLHLEGKIHVEITDAPSAALKECEKLAATDLREVFHADPTGVSEERMEGGGETNGG